MELHSPEDHTVELKIPKQAWIRFIEEHDEELPGAKSNLIAFKNSLSSQINKALRDQDDGLELPEDENLVADV